MIIKKQHSFTADSKKKNFFYFKDYSNSMFCIVLGREVSI